MKGFALLVALLPFAAAAATITVTSTADNTIAGNGQCTLREAIANVNAAADTTGGDCTAADGVDDAIKFGFAMPGKILLAHGELQIQRSVSLANPAPGSLRIDAAGKSRAFEVTAGTTSMTGLTIQHGRAGFGGGILVEQGATLSMTNCVVAGNRASDGPVGMVYGLADAYGAGIYNAGTLNLTDCTLSRNQGIAQGDCIGGGIYNAFGTLTVTSSVLVRNRCESTDSSFGTAGGGIHNAGGTVTLTKSLLSKNSLFLGYGVASGGGISNFDGVLTVADSKLDGNKVTGPRGEFVNSFGGGIYNASPTANLGNCTFTRNAALGGPDSSSDGGGVYNETEGTMALTNCTFDRNVSFLNGYGESYGGGLENEGSMTLTGCTFSRNAALLDGNGVSAGGGIYNGNTLSLTNCTLTGNRANSCTSMTECGSNGGGIYSEGTLTLTNCTLSGNTSQRLLAYTSGYASGGGGIAAYPPATLINTIVANSGVGQNCDVTMDSAGHNLSSDGSCFASGGSDLLNTAPRLAPLANYGGSTQTMALCTAAGVPAGCRAASPAINAGDDTVTGPPDNLGSDQRGLPRRSGAHVDMGAYEVQ